MSWSKHVGGRGRQIHFSLTPRCDRESLAHKLVVSRLPRKASMEVFKLSVPQTATGRWGENPKVLEITLVKELGKMAP